MKKLSREEIQKLKDDKLNWKLHQIKYKDKPNHPSNILDPKVFPCPCNYCTSLDAQVDLAERFEIQYQINYDPSSQLFDRMYIFTVNGFEKRGETKRIGAELLLEVIQELVAQR